jgi:hypothetical protein
VSVSSVKLPLVEPFELTHPSLPPAPSDPAGVTPELEDALMSALTAMGAPHQPAVPQRAAVAAPSPPVAAPEPDRPKLDSLDPQVVARRVAQLRRPVPRPDTPPRIVRPPDPALRNLAAAGAKPPSRWEPPRKSEAPAAAPRPPATGAFEPNRVRPALQPAAPQERRAAAAAAVAAPAPVETPTEQERLNDAAERTLRGWSIGDELVTQVAARPRPQARPGVVAIAMLLLVGAGGGTMIVQWLSPRDPAVAATSPVPAATMSATVGNRSAGPAPAAAVGPQPAPAVQVAIVPPASAPVATPPAAPIVVVTPQPSAPVLLATPRQTVPSSAHPSWYLEDDPTALEPVTAAPAGKRMLVTADVDVRSGPDPTTDSMGVLRAGAQIAVGDCNRWCAVSIDGKTGWVFSAFLAEPATTAVR